MQIKFQHRIAVREGGIGGGTRYGRKRLYLLAGLREGTIDNSGKALGRATRSALETVGLGPGMRCLDLGCGPGEVMRLMGELVGPNGAVLGIDVDGAMGREAVEVLRQTGRSQFSFVEQNLSEPDPLPEGPFDVVFARLLLVHLPNRLDVLRRMYEATRPGGVVLVQDAYSASFSILPPRRSLGRYRKNLPRHC